MPFIPGTATVYHPNGAVIKHPQADYLVRENDDWRKMTEEEIAAYIREHGEIV